MEVYKKHNYNVGGTCLVTLITMVLTMVVFFTLFAGLNKMSSYKVAKQYEDMRLAYYGVENVENGVAFTFEVAKDSGYYDNKQ